MGLISRVSSRTYRSYHLKKPTTKSKNGYRYQTQKRPKGRPKSHQIRRPLLEHARQALPISRPTNRLQIQPSRSPTIVHEPTKPTTFVFVPTLFQRQRRKNFCCCRYRHQRHPIAPGSQIEVGCFASY